ncbi:MAG: hypothetical protein GEV11_14080 [Streptosporangiales bacterium]|nr:hypothetical protein [Streptosporangiales bacterium]
MNRLTFAWSRRRRFDGLAVLLAMTLWALTGCGLFGGAVSDKPTINQDQAEARIDELIAEAMKGLDPKPRLERFEEHDLLRRCLDPADGGSEDRVVVSKRYWLEDIPKKEPNAQIAEQVIANMKKAGHSVFSTNGLGTDKPEIFIASRPDDFRMSLIGSADGSLSIGATSPCVWQGGTPGGEPTLD